MTTRRAPAPQLRIGLAGFGTVGQSLARLLLEEGPRIEELHGVKLSLAAIANRGAARKRQPWVPPGVRWLEDPLALATDPGVDVVVELMGGLEPAGTLVLGALSSGRSVVTANKLLLARRGEEIARAAREGRAALGIEAAVAGGIPVLRALRESFTGDRLLGVTGILNGTCNFVLTEMERTGRAFGEVLAEAQALGYAEADPTSDVSGQDAAYKLALLSRMAFAQAVPVEAVRVEGIDRLLPCDFVYAAQLHRTPRQLGLSRLLPSGRLLLSVRTHMVAVTSILAKVAGPFNAVQLTGEHGGDFVLYGRGAGGAPTATAVLADLVAVARGGAATAPPLGFEAFAPFAPAGPEESVAPFYLRFVVRDRPGILAEICRCLAAHGINIEAVWQAPWADKDALPFVVTLEPVAEAELSRALSEIAALGFHAAEPLALPMTP